MSLRDSIEEGVSKALQSPEVESAIEDCMKAAFSNKVVFIRTEDFPKTSKIVFGLCPEEGLWQTTYYSQKRSAKEFGGLPEDYSAGWVKVTEYDIEPWHPKYITAMKI